MIVLVLSMVAFTVIATLVVITIGLLCYRGRRQLDVLIERLGAEQRIDMATRATLQAMRDAARQSRG